MTPEQYEDLLADIRVARRELDRAQLEARVRRAELEALMKQLDQEESRIAHEALHSAAIASRKLVIHE